MYVSLIGFVVRCAAIVIALTLRKTTNFIRTWYAGMLLPEDDDPRFDLGCDYLSEDTADNVHSRTAKDLGGSVGTDASTQEDISVDTETSTQVDMPRLAALAPPPRYYVGPAMYVTWQPPPPSVESVIAAGFNFPPPPLPECYVGPAWFDVFGPPPLPCCVAASMFSYPPPPLLRPIYNIY